MGGTTLSKMTNNKEQIIKKIAEIFKLGYKIVQVVVLLSTFPLIIYIWLTSGATSQFELLTYLAVAIWSLLLALFALKLMLWAMKHALLGLVKLYYWVRPGWVRI